MLNLIHPDVQAYAEKYTSEEDALLREVNEYTVTNHPEAVMLSGHLQGKLLEMISCMIKPERILEIIEITGTTTITKQNGNSFLIGGGYTTGREGRGGQPFYYIAVLFDLSDDANSPYTDAYGRSIPIIRAGLQIPLFQGPSRGSR